MTTFLIDLAKLIQELTGKQFYIDPVMEGQRGGDLHEVIKMHSGGIKLRRVRDSVDMWIAGCEILGFDWALHLRHKLAIDGDFGICFRAK